MTGIAFLDLHMKRIKFGDTVFYALANNINININNNNTRRVGKAIPFDELLQSLNDQVKQNAKDGKKEMVRIPRVRRDAVKDGKSSAPYRNRIHVKAN
jgi:uncharacterized protein YabE (DUF348 family)